MTTTTSRRIADGLFVLVAHHMDLGETWVVAEDEFVQMMKLDTEYFNPMVNRNCYTISGEEFNGYVWFNKHVNRLARDNDNVADFLMTICENFSGYDFGRYLTVPNYEGYDREDLEGPILHSMVIASNLSPALLKDVRITGLGDGLPWEEKHSGEGPQCTYLYDEDKGIYKEAESPEQPVTRPMWLL